MPCTSSTNSWKQWIPTLIIIICVIATVVVGLLYIGPLQQVQVALYTKPWVLASIFVLATMMVSVWEIFQHIVHYTQPEVQQPIIRILWMAPIYSLNSWVALMKPSAATYLNTLRDAYELYIIYNFMLFLNNYLASEYKDITSLLKSKKQQKHILPCCFLPPWEMSTVLPFRCKRGILQYIPTKIVTTVFAVIFKSLGMYQEGVFSFKNSWIYLVTLSSISQMAAVYCLSLLCATFKEELKPVRIIAKLLSVKLIIFVSFLQGGIFAILVKCKVISRGPLWDWQSPEEVAIGLQDFLICLEMFVVGIAHHYLYSHKPYMRSQEEGSCFKSFLATWNSLDKTDNVAEQISHMGTSTSRSSLSRCTICGQHKQKNHTEGQDETIPTGGQNEKKNSAFLPPTSEDGVSCVSSLPRAVTHHTANTVINMPEEMVSETAGAKKCEYIPLPIPDEVVSDSPDDTSETGEEEVVKEVDE